jgi:hypothetical protein
VVTGGVEARLKVPEVVWIGGRGEDLLDDGEKVAQGTDGWHGLVRAEGPARDGEEESLFDNFKIDVSIMKRARRLAVIAKDVAECAGELPVAVKEVGDVTVPGVHYATSGRAACTWSAETDLARARAAAKRAW